MGLLRIEVQCIAPRQDHPFIHEVHFLANVGGGKPSHILNRDK